MRTFSGIIWVSQYNYKDPFKSEAGGDDFVTRDMMKEQGNDHKSMDTGTIQKLQKIKETDSSI